MCGTIYVLVNSEQWEACFEVKPQRKSLASISQQSSNWLWGSDTLHNQDQWHRPIPITCHLIPTASSSESSLCPERGAHFAQRWLSFLFYLSGVWVSDKGNRNHRYHDKQMQKRTGWRGDDRNSGTWWTHPHGVCDHHTGWGRGLGLTRNVRCA